MNNYILNNYERIIKIASLFSDEPLDLAHDVIIKLYKIGEEKDPAQIFVITRNLYINKIKREVYTELTIDIRSEDSLRRKDMQVDVFDKIKLSRFERALLIAYIEEGSFTKVAKEIDLKCRQTVSKNIKEIIEKCRQQL